MISSRQVKIVKCFMRNRTVLWKVSLELTKKGLLSTVHWCGVPAYGCRSVAMVQPFSEIRPWLESRPQYMYLGSTTRQKRRNDATDFNFFHMHCSESEP